MIALSSASLQAQSDPNFPTTDVFNWVTLGGIGEPATGRFDIADIVGGPPGTDVSPDGWPDIAICTNRHITILRNTGDWSPYSDGLVLHCQLAIPTHHHPQDIKLADVNGDNLRDIIYNLQPSVGAAQVVVYLNQGEGTFGTNESSEDPCEADPDVVIELKDPNYPGFANKPLNLTNGMPSGLIVTDLDNANGRDIAVAGWSAESADLDPAVMVLMHSPPATDLGFTADLYDDADAFDYSAVAVDIVAGTLKSGGGLPDFATSIDAWPGHSVTLNSSGTLSASFVPNVGTVSAGLAVGAFRPSDSYHHLALAQSYPYDEAEAHLLENNGNGVFQAAFGKQLDNELFQRAHGVAAGHFNGDSLLDVAIACRGDQANTDGIALVMGASNLTFGSTVYKIGQGYFPWHVKVADLDRDCTVDIVSLSNNANVLEIVVFINGRIQVCD